MVNEDSFYFMLVSMIQRQSQYELDWTTTGGYFIGRLQYS